MKIPDSALSLIQNADCAEHLLNIQRGIEKESLRVDSTGNLALTPHPESLGSALCNEWLTTDFSESLLEFITPVHTDSSKLLGNLTNLHKYTLDNLNHQEVLWPGSMPGVLPEDSKIPLAVYGDSNVGLMKTAYRRGLGHRYGRAMQCVAGIHYNFSMPAAFWQYERQVLGINSSPEQNYINGRYLDLVRNFRRYYWLLIYLFGASPVADPSFVQGRKHNLKTLATQDLYSPYATSLRMGDLGYQSKAQQALFVCYNQLDSYLDTLREGLNTPYEAYEKYGVCVDGVYQQLSTSILQIENEFYSPIRPKRVTQSGQTPARALSENGVQYIEVRCLDLNPYEPNGINIDTIAFLDLFLLAALFGDSPLCDEQEFKATAENQRRVVNFGRKPDITIIDSATNHSEESLPVFANKLLDQMEGLAETLDQQTAQNIYKKALVNARAKVNDVSITPSAKVLEDIRSRDISLTQLGLSLAETHKNTLMEKPMAAALKLEFETDVKQSLARQIEIEANNDISFETYLENYFSQ